VRAIGNQANSDGAASLPNMGYEDAVVGVPAPGVACIVSTAGCEIDQLAPPYSDAAGRRTLEASPWVFRDPTASSHAKMRCVVALAEGSNNAPVPIPPAPLEPETGDCIYCLAPNSGGPARVCTSCKSQQDMYFPAMLARAKEALPEPTGPVAGKLLGSEGIKGGLDCITVEMARLAAGAATRSAVKAIVDQSSAVNGTVNTISAANGTVNMSSAVNSTVNVSFAVDGTVQKSSAVNGNVHTSSAAIGSVHTISATDGTVHTSSAANGTAQKNLVQGRPSAVAAVDTHISLCADITVFFAKQKEVLQKQLNELGEQRSKRAQEHEARKEYLKTLLDAEDSSFRSESERLDSVAAMFREQICACESVEKQFAVTERDAAKSRPLEAECTGLKQANGVVSLLPGPGVKYVDKNRPTEPTGTDVGKRTADGLLPLRSPRKKARTKSPPTETLQQNSTVSAAQGTFGAMIAPPVAEATVDHSDTIQIENEVASPEVPTGIGTPGNSQAMNASTFPAVAQPSPRGASWRRNGNACDTPTLLTPVFKNMGETLGVQVTVPRPSKAKSENVPMLKLSPTKPVPPPVVAQKKKKHPRKKLLQ
jgi:hypothetical protein